MRDRSPPVSARAIAAPGADMAAAMRHAHDLAARGQPALALAWMERAARLAPADDAVRYALAAARLAAGDGAGAARAVETVLASRPFRAGARLLVLACCMAGAWARAAGALAHFLRVYGFDPALRIPADLICRHMARPGWCALDPDGGVHWGGLPDGHDPEVRLDGRKVPLAGPTGRTMTLPPRWRRAHDITLAHDGAPLLGSHPDPAALCSPVGAVWPDARGVTGWVFMPAQPDRRPGLWVEDAHGRRPLALSGTVREGVHGPGLPVWGFDVAWAELAPHGAVRVVTADGRDLAGSPLPVRLPRARRVFPAPHARGATPARTPRRAACCRVVIPVYADRARTLACLDSVRHSLPPVGVVTVQVMVVDDATPDPVLARALDDRAARGEITLRRHATNSGYPAAVNTALADARGMDVVLLNSDTLVAPGWLDEMLRVAYARADTGTVSPLSNDASILTWPDPALPRPLAGGLAEVRHLMATALRANGGRDVDIPTAHGFCMLIRHDCLRQTGPFRPALFGQGYGEENDFSMRARLAGWRHRAAPGVFVGHVGGVSFGWRRAALQQRNLWVLNRLFPGYDALVRAHVRADPLAAARQRLSLLVWRGAGVRAGLRGAVLLVTHAEAGGVGRVIGQRAGMWRARGLLPVVLAPVPGGFVLNDGGVGEACPPLTLRWPEYGPVLVALLRALGLARIEVHHHLGHGGRVRDLCDRLGRELGVPYDRHVHDYAGICPRITLVGPAGRYCGEPDMAGCRACIRTLGALGDEADVSRLRHDTARDLASARRVVVPCADVARRLARYFPAISCTLQPLEDDRPDQSLTCFAAAGNDAPAPGLPPPTGRCRVVVAGAIGPEKGHGVVLAAARDAAMRDLPLEFMVVGHTCDDASLLETGRVFITGPYGADDAVALVRGCAGQVGFVPSVCPETWCFTLTLLWRAGLRSVAFDLGAPAARIRATGRGCCVPLGLSVHQLNTFLLSYALSRS
ncbi:hypothetical protein JCM25156A_15900 [Komagataeibacter kakiaceti JCM 25156]